MNNPTTPPLNLQGWALDLVERKSWASLWHAVNPDVGADYFLVMIEKTPLSLELFGRRRLWAFRDKWHATQKFAEVCGH